MPGGLYNRVVARGFPSSVTAGMTGAGALESQGGTADPAHGDRSYGPPPSTLTGFSPEGPGEVGLPIVGDVQGPGELTDPDQTPGYGPGTFRTHAAPMPGHAGSYHDQQEMATLHRNSAEIHAQDFGGQKLQDFLPGQPPGTVALPMEPWEGIVRGDSDQVPLEGPARGMGQLSHDRVQGYSLSNGYDFDGGHRYRPEISGNVINAYLDPAERPFIIPQASGTYIPTDAVQGPEPWGSYLAADNVNYDSPSAYQAPPDPATLTAPLLEATSWGW